MRSTKALGFAWGVLYYNGELCLDLELHMPCLYTTRDEAEKHKIGADKIVEVGIYSKPPTAKRKHKGAGGAKR